MEFLHLFVYFNLISLCILVFIVDNPVHSVLFLILAFFNAAVILFFFDVEFLGITFIILYVGAIARLFLFVAMMLNVKIFTFDLTKFYFLCFLIFIVFFFQILILTFKLFFQFELKSLYSSLPLFTFDSLESGLPISSNPEIDMETWILLYDGDLLLWYLFNCGMQQLIFWILLKYLFEVARLISEELERLAEEARIKAEAEAKGMNGQPEPGKEDPDKLGETPSQGDESVKLDNIIDAAEAVILDILEIFFSIMF